MAAAELDVGQHEGEVGDDAGQAEAERHVIVNAEHIGAQALVDRSGGPGDASAGAGVGVAVIVGHETSYRRGGERPARGRGRARRVSWSGPRSRARAADGVVDRRRLNRRSRRAAEIGRAAHHAAAARRRRHRSWSAPGTRRRAPSLPPAGAPSSPSPASPPARRRSRAPPAPGSAPASVSSAAVRPQTTDSRRRSRWRSMRLSSAVLISARPNAPPRLRVRLNRPEAFLTRSGDMVPSARLLIGTMHSISESRAASAARTAPRSPNRR